MEHRPSFLLKEHTKFELVGVLWYEQSKHWYSGANGSTVDFLHWPDGNEQSTIRSVSGIRRAVAHADCTACHERSEGVPLLLLRPQYEVGSDSSQFAMLKWMNSGEARIPQLAPSTSIVERSRRNWAQGFSEVIGRIAGLFSKTTECATSRWTWSLVQFTSLGQIVQIRIAA